MTPAQQRALNAGQIGTPQRETMGHCGGVPTEARLVGHMGQRFSHAKQVGRSVVEPGYVDEPPSVAADGLQRT